MADCDCAPANSWDDLQVTERSSARLERVVWVHEVAGSNPVAPTIFLSAIRLQNSLQIIHGVIRNHRAGSRLVKISSRGQKRTGKRFLQGVGLFSIRLKPL